MSDGVLSRLFPWRRDITETSRRIAETRNKIPIAQMEFTRAQWICEALTDLDNTSGSATGVEPWRYERT